MKRALVYAVAACGLVLLTACGGSSTTPTSNPTPEPTPTATPRAGVPPGPQYVEFAIQITGRVGGGSTTPPNVAWTKDMKVDIEPLSSNKFTASSARRLFLSGSADGQNPYHIDDALRLTATTESGSTKTFYYDASQGCSKQLVDVGPSELTDYFDASGGRRHAVHVELIDMCSGAWGTEGLWLVAFLECPGGNPCVRG